MNYNSQSCNAIYLFGRLCVESFKFPNAFVASLSHHTKEKLFLACHNSQMQNVLTGGKQEHLTDTYSPVLLTDSVATIYFIISFEKSCYRFS